MLTAEQDGAVPSRTSVARCRAMIENRLGEIVPEGGAGRALGEAMRYALLASAKRFRPVVMLLLAESAGVSPRLVLDAAAAVELVHTASLILDDLPAMDDARLRRGRPTTHQRFGEAVAILAAIALLARAFEIVAIDGSLAPEIRAGIGAMIARAVGREGLSAGQELDLAGACTSPTFADITTAHRLKTGALFVAAVESVGLAARLAPADQVVLHRFAEGLGLAFQAADDLLDARASTTTAGKDVGRDGNRPALSRLLSPAEAESLLRQRCLDLKSTLACLSFDAGALGDYVIGGLSGLIEDGRWPDMA